LRDCPNKHNDQGDAFFIGMSMDEEGCKFHQRTPSEHAKHEDYLRNKEAQIRESCLVRMKNLHLRKGPEHVQSVE